jgi:hypothetical protein
MHTSGEYFQAEFEIAPAKNDPQGVGSAITYQKRYALAAVLGLKIQDEDDDGNAASGNTPQRPAAPRSATPRGTTKAPQRPAAASKAETPAQKFEKAKKMIAGSKNPDGLIEYSEKLKNSDTYDSEQKKVLMDLIEKRLAELE